MEKIKTSEKKKKKKTQNDGPETEDAMRGYREKRRQIARYEFMVGDGGRHARIFRRCAYTRQVRYVRVVDTSDGDTVPRSFGRREFPPSCIYRRRRPSASRVRRRDASASFARYVTTRRRVTHTRNSPLYSAEKTPPRTVVF